MQEYLSAHALAALVGEGFLSISLDFFSVVMVRVGITCGMELLMCQWGIILMGKSILIMGGVTSWAGDPGLSKVKKVGEYQLASIHGPDDGCL